MARRSAQDDSTVSPARRLGWLGASALLVAGLVGLLMFQPWATNAETGTPSNEFASDRDGGAAATPVAFDGERAMEYLEAICKIGPRISGSEGMRKQQDLVRKHFEKLGAKVTFQRFPAKQKSQRRPVEMANMVISFHPDRTRRAILCSHYDTRPIADQEPNPRRWEDPFVSANDGGSGVALLMEMGNHMKGLKTTVGVDFVLFDGEEYIFNPKGDDYFFGSKHFAREYGKVKKKMTYTGAILLDMVAGKGATFPVEQNSNLLASKLVREVWKIAKELNCEAFEEKLSSVAVDDDHIALNRGGIPAIDIIDFDYPHWHKLTDLPKNCSPGPMEQVAKVCGVWLQRTR
jgi:glutaminyl-peptide cyclotransferase